MTGLGKQRLPKQHAHRRGAGSYTGFSSQFTCPDPPPRAFSPVVPPAACWFASISIFPLIVPEITLSTHSRWRSNRAVGMGRVIILDSDLRRPSPHKPGLWARGMLDCLWASPRLWSLSRRLSPVLTGFPRRLLRGHGQLQGPANPPGRSIFCGRNDPRPEESSCLGETLTTEMHGLTKRLQLQAPAHRCLEPVVDRDLLQGRGGIVALPGGEGMGG